MHCKKRAPASQLLAPLLLCPSCLIRACAFLQDYRRPAQGGAALTRDEWRRQGGGGGALVATGTRQQGAPVQPLPLMTALRQHLVKQFEFTKAAESGKVCTGTYNVMLSGEQQAKRAGERAGEPKWRSCVQPCKH